MGLFSRRAKKEDPRSRAANVFDERAAEFRPQIPATFPDGTPFPAREAFDEVMALGKVFAYSSHPQTAELMMYCLKTMARFTTVTRPESFRASDGLEAMTARQLLLQAGLVQEERGLSRALLLIQDYHEKAGHDVIMDLDAEGNLI